MIEQIDRRLKEWAENTLNISGFSLKPPGDTPSGQGVSFYLLELIEAPPPRSVKRAPLQLSLCYLVTTWAEEPEEAHRLLGELAFAAMGSAEYEAEFKPVPAALWAALGVVPRPSFVLRVPCRRERPEPVVKRVHLPVVVKAMPMAGLQGVVLGPGDVPLVGATVELPALNLSTQADAKGRFRFAAVPGPSSTNRLRVRARGRELSVVVEDAVPEAEPLVIRFDSFD
jgi:hypothetical protein